MASLRRRIAVWLTALASIPTLTLAEPPGQTTPVTGWRLQDVGKVAESGEAISRPDYKPENWFRATVPGTVLTSLVNDGVYPEPLYGENNRSIPESLSRTSYWYRATFAVPPHQSYSHDFWENLRKTGAIFIDPQLKDLPGRRVWVNFDGINYQAEIWVDGIRLPTGSAGGFLRAGGQTPNIAGAFTRGYLDITNYLEPGKKIAAVAVRISPPPHPGNPLEQTVANGTGPNGGALGADGPTFEATVGWDWIPGIRDRDMGIWQGINLTTTGNVVIRDPYVTCTLPLPRTNSAELSIQSVVTLAGAFAHSGILEGTVEGTNIRFQIPLTLDGANPSKTVNVPPIHLSHPRLWWPNGYGPQNIYKLHLRFREDRQISDEKTVSFGIRTIDYFPNGTKNLTIVVNGGPIFAKGGNWGMDEAMKRSPVSRLDAQMRLHRDANCTMIRNWVGMSTEEDFYQACDKYGILVWDDFWLANPVDGPNPLDPDLFIANAREKILRFRNHPSIAVWCGRNEGMPPTKINYALMSMIAELDGKRFYQPHSSSLNGVGGGGPYSYQKPANYFGPFRDAFHTEIGGPSIPTLEAIENMMPRRDWWPMNDDWAEHDLCRGAQRGDVYPQVLSNRFGQVTGLEDFVRKAQLANYESYRAIFEGRAERLFYPVSGVLLWMSNPSQPSFVWQLYSYDLEPTAAMFGVQRGAEPVHVEMDPRDRQVYVVNGTPRSLGAVDVRAIVFDVSGSQLFRQDGTSEIAAGRSMPVFKLDLSRAPGWNGSVYFVRLEACDADGRVLSSNFYWQSRPTAENGYLPNDFSAMQFMPTVTLQAQASVDQRARGESRISVTLRNPSKSIALMTHLQLRRADSNERVLPAFYSDNYISLVPGESRKVTIDCATADLHGEAPKVFVDGWNVRVDASSAGVAVATNEAAIPGELPVRRDVAASSSTFNRDLAVATVNMQGTSFMPDDDFVDGGFARTQDTKVDTASAGDKAAPAFVYQTPRNGEMTYTVPVPPGRTYTVRLHFADLTSSEPGTRSFNVLLNGKQVLTDFDIVKVAGGRAKAVYQEFDGVQPDSDGNIVIALRRGAAGLPTISAVQIQYLGRPIHPEFRSR